MMVLAKELEPRTQGALTWPELRMTQNFWLRSSDLEVLSQLQLYKKKLFLEALKFLSNWGKRLFGAFVNVSVTSSRF